MLFSFYTDFSPTLQKYPVQSHMVGALNGEIIIMCKPEAAPAPTITWTKNSINISPDGNRIKLMPNGNLQINDLSYGDAGFYTCIADNGIPPAAKSTGQLVIQCMSLSFLLWNLALVIRTFFYLKKSSNACFQKRLLWRKLTNCFELYKLPKSPEIVHLYNNLEIVKLITLGW